MSSWRFTVVRLGSRSSLEPTHTQAVSGGQKLRPESLQLSWHVLPTPQRIHQSQTSLLLLFCFLRSHTQQCSGLEHRHLWVEGKGRVQAHFWGKLALGEAWRESWGKGGICTGS